MHLSILACKLIAKSSLAVPRHQSGVYVCGTLVAYVALIVVVCVSSSFLASVVLVFKRPCDLARMKPYCP